ncbi:MAG: hypothetical protein IJ689_02875 [Alphaproteobacteria bacterium]|nr:hypothetical protein [Alphaproteobacteria bacterium]
MKKYILMLGVAGVALGSYCAYAGNSATMTVTATIAHDVSLTVTQSPSFGTITINPAYPSETDSPYVDYNESGTVRNKTDAYIINATAATPGEFTANIPNPTDCNGSSYECGGLEIPNSGEVGVVGDATGYNYCQFIIKYTGSSNVFKLLPDACNFNDVRRVTAGTHSANLTISYTPQ